MSRPLAYFVGALIVACYVRYYTKPPSALRMIPGSLRQGDDLGSLLLSRDPVLLEERVASPQDLFDGGLLRYTYLLRTRPTPLSNTAWSLPLPARFTVILCNASDNIKNFYVDVAHGRFASDVVRVKVGPRLLLMPAGWSVKPGGCKEGSAVAIYAYDALHLLMRPFARVLL